MKKYLKSEDILMIGLIIYLLTKKDDEFWK